MKYEYNVFGKKDAFRLAIVFPIVVAIISTMIIYVLSNPLRQSPELIREAMLKFTPIGTSFDAAVIILEAAKDRNNWQSITIRSNVGVHLYFHSISPEARAYVIGKLDPDDNTVGEQSIQVFFGRYYELIPWTAVQAFWIFDENGELIEVFATKHWSRAAQHPRVFMQPRPSLNIIPNVAE